ncbi:MAG: carbamate kinase [Ignavibacteriaceae bacterium]|nr:carbamate kinase [Ignavibacteriaceae bacterium]
MKKVALIALGGNALIREHQTGTIKEQEFNASSTCKFLVDFIWKGYDIVIVHGNGPQVGNILLKNEAGYEKFRLPRFPLDVCVAESQGQIGYILMKQLQNLLFENNISKQVVNLVSPVIVSKDDPAFKNPTKPVGPFFIKEEAELLTKSNGWVFKEDARKRGWRRVVASPEPVKIFNSEVVKELLNLGHIVIAAGGGGIPYVQEKDSKLTGVEAVIDKDLAGAELALEIGASEFYILTDVPKVYINFRKENELALDKVTVEEAEKYIEEGHFGEGSMGPKVAAAVKFIKKGGSKAVITEASELLKASAGTHFIKN